MTKYVLIAIVLVVIGSIVVWQQDAQVLVLNQPLSASKSPQFNNERTFTNTTQDGYLTQLNTFKGAQADGYLRTDHRGKLIVDINLRRWIDFHLSAQGEVPLEEIVQFMQQQIVQLPEPGRAEALRILDAYLAYLTALADYDSETARRQVEASFDELELRLNWQQRLRRQYLDPDVVSAFFQDDEAIDQHTLMTRRLQRDGASAEELAALEQNLPADIQQARQESRLLIQHAQSEQALREQGASAQEIYQWRVQEYGAEAADRLAKLDAEQSAWQAKLTAYQRYAASLTDVAASEREQQLQTYLDKHFSETEQKRLPAALTLLSTQ